MPKRSSKPPSDPVVAAFQAVAKLTGTNETPAKPLPREKNPAAVALGRLGGKKGGKARADRLSPERRSEIAREAAKKRWQQP